MTTQSIFEARELVSFAGETAAALRRADERLVALEMLGDERAWLQAALRRVSEESASTQSALGEALPLPELEPERQAKARASFQAWVDSIEGLLFGMTTHVSPGNPLIEVLFPHQKLDKLRRGGNAARTYMSEFERRRGTSYVLRMATEPEYTFLPPLLANVDRARAQLALDEAPISLGASELEALRQTVFAAADALKLALAQARLLGEAALISSPGLLAELGLDAKPRKRPAARSTQLASSRDASSA